jgi:hypothetical protein
MAGLEAHVMAQGHSVPTLSACQRESTGEAAADLDREAEVEQLPRKFRNELVKNSISLAGQK